MDLLLTLAGLAVLLIGAEGLLRGAVELALRARLSPLVIGLTVVSMGTSLPELLVSLLALLNGSAAISVGNVVGSNIANISLVLGIAVLLFPVEVDRQAWRIHWPVMMLASVVFVWAVQDDTFGRWEGVGYLLALTVYVVYNVRASRRHHPSTSEQSEVPVKAPLWRSLGMLLLGIVALAFGADWFVKGAVGLAEWAGMSQQLIGLTVVAVGTSMPELITSIVAALRKQPDISLGNLIGSNIFNLLGILGLTAMVRPIPVDSVAFRTDLWAMMLVALVLFPMMRIGGRMGRWQGAVVLCSYLVYIWIILQRG
ncbi:MAG: calcium/sodium antiporter [Flavobacteriales bacterium]|nr:calcium/sodium antiporter [Flavobacteriales bacterium]